ncbi:MAG: DUF6105 family protein, partial [Rhizobiaceae bacterium]|nr:DUF6105 family protein [Rhizobiaceae bacterium]
LLLWAFPVVFFWGWYGLSYYDINFGTQVLSRQVHDVIFALYGKILGMPAGDVPLALAKIFFIDTLIVFAFAAWRWRKDWYPQTKLWVISKYQTIRHANSEIATDPVHPAE